MTNRPAPVPTSELHPNARAVRMLARRFTERAQGLGYKGKRRDDMALEYFIGAAVIAEEAGNPQLSRMITGYASMLVAVRGYVAVAEIAAWDAPT